MKLILIKSICFLAIIVAISLVLGPSGVLIDHDIITSIRLPRLLTALSCGAATGVAGGLSQSMFKNSLATPSVMGTESGAASALALAVLLFGSEQLGTPFFWALLGAFFATSISMALARIDERYPVSALLIGGFAVNAFMSSITAICVTILMERGDGLSLYHWLLGSFSARTWTHVSISALGLIIFAAVAFRSSRQLDLLSTGTQSALSMGIHVPRLRMIMIALIGGLTATSITCGGALPFVGLIAPHLARQKGITHNRQLIVMAGMHGALITAIADLLARTVRAPIDTDVGLITAFVGAPYFLRMLWKQIKARKES